MRYTEKHVAVFSCEQQNYVNQRLAVSFHGGTISSLNYKSKGHWFSS